MCRTAALLRRTKKSGLALQKDHCHDPEFIFVIGTRQEWQFSFFSTSSATQSGALDLRISARRICFIMVHSLRSIAPHDAVNSLLPGPALGMANSFASIRVNIITTNLGEDFFLLCFHSIHQREERALIRTAHRIAPTQSLIMIKHEKLYNTCL
ncbi:MAG: hypothetical protein GX463_03265 [Methanothrix sp.]|jgi:hypothetical protein|nr:hypothetical protein [Methanothrix sp.]